MIYAIIKNDTIINVVEAENTVPFSVIFPDADDYIEFTTESGPPIIGLGCKAKKFQPSPSWTFDDSLGEWVAPKPRPEGDAHWDESTLSWIEIELPTVEEENA